MNKRVVESPVRNPLRQQVTEILRNAIARCEFAPGGRLTERELCEMLNVSRSTVRESLRQLETEGLVRITPNKGPVVTALDEREARELYAIRAQLEAYASSLSAQNADPRVVETMEANLAEMREAVAANDFVSLQLSKTRFYNCLFESSGNTQLAAILKQLRARNALMRGVDHQRPSRMEESVRGAMEVLNALRSGDPAVAAAASVAHIERAAELAIEALRHGADLKAAI